jgi:hypothetical protein
LRFQGTYIYSAFFNQDKINRNEEKTIVVLSWQQENASINRYKCCVVANNEILSLQSSKTNYFVRGYGRLYASRVECHVPTWIISIDYVSIVKQIDECPTERTFYITVTVRKQITNRPNLAICNKYLYGSIDAFQLIEWFEVNRFHGVDTFTIHYNPSLNALSKRVLRYYENKGILQALELIPPLEGMFQIYFCQQKETIYGNTFIKNILKSLSGVHIRCPYGDIFHIVLPGPNSFLRNIYAFIRNINLFLQNINLFLRNIIS